MKTTTLIILRGDAQRNLKAETDSTRPHVFREPAITSSGKRSSERVKQWPALWGYTTSLQLLTTVSSCFAMHHT